VVPEEGEDLGDGNKIVRLPVGDLDKDELRTLVDRFRDKIKSGVVVLAASADEKVSIVVGVTSNLTKKVSAGQVVKELAPLVGGRGGGRPDFAEAGGKDVSKVADMLAASRDVVKKLLS
jgi:alanyl-tRNA synthetase